MPKNLFAYILRYSKRQQIMLISMICCAFPFYYLSLDLPKTIINDAINGSQFPVEIAAGIFGYSFSIGSFQQIHYLLLLCLMFLTLVVINGGFKYFINVYRGILGERMLRRLRFQLIERIMGFPLARFRKTSQGELVSMVNQETEPLAGFIGECFSLPLYQGGMMITILIFMFIQDWKLGIAAIALYPLQTWLIPKLQRKVNLLNQERIIHMRKLAENLGETVSGVSEIRVNDTREYLKSRFSEQLGGLFGIRVQIFRKKFFIKFLNSFIGQITPFTFFLLGGILVIRGELSFGALVAVLAAYKDLSPPWKELLAWYQLQADARMKFTLLVEQFTDSEFKTQPTKSTPAEIASLAGSVPPIRAESVSLEQSDGTVDVSGISLDIKPGEWIRIVGSGSSGKNTLAHLLAGLVSPTSGKVLLGSHDMTGIPDTVKGRIFGYAGHDSYLFSSTIQENIVFSLMHPPSLDQPNIHSNEINQEQQHWLEEARLSGNSELKSSLDWIDYSRAGVADADELRHRISLILKAVNLEDELVQIALKKAIISDDHPFLVDGLLKARNELKSRVFDEDLGLVVESFDPQQYNNNASVAENILFGSAIDSEFSLENLSDNPVIRQLIHKYELDNVFREASLSIASTMVDILSDLPSDHEIFDRYNLVDAEEVITLKRILKLLDLDDQIENLESADRKLLKSLPFRLVVGRHRLGVFEPEHIENLIKIRQEILTDTDSRLDDKINFFTPEKYSDTSSIGDNIIFGRITFSRRGAADIVYRQILDILKAHNLIPYLLEVGLSAPSGLAGGLLPTSRRQKIVLARALMKQPDILIINEGLNALNGDDSHQVLQNIKKAFPAVSLLWIDSQEQFDSVFDRSVIVDSGRISRSEYLTAPSTSDQPKDTVHVPQKSRTAASVLMNEKIDLVRHIPIFRSLDRPMIQIIAKTSTAVDIPKGKRLFDQGDPGDALYVIVEGTASVLMRYGDKDVPISQRGENEVIGELAVLSEEPRTASVEAITDLVTLRLDREEFIDIIQSHGDVGYQLLQVITSKLIEVNRLASAESWSLGAPDSTDQLNSKVSS